MLRSVRIQNFRQFRDLTLDGLARINLITGKNDTGKTSLLEALWLYAAGPVDPSVVQSMARLRGLDQLPTVGPSAWGWIFHDLAHHDGIRITSTGAANGVGPTDRVETVQALAASEADAVLLAVPRSAPQPRIPTVSTAGVAARALKILYTDPSGAEHTASFTVKDGEISLTRAPDVLDRNWYFLATRPGDPEREAQLFDQLVLAGYERQIVEAYRLIDPRITGARALNPGTGQRIYVSMADGAFLPISVMGNGFYRMGKVATAMIEASHGLALIDEIDDGLHYSVLTDLWALIVTLAVTYDVQVFATTHSYECLEAAVTASEDHEGTLAFFRLERRDDDIEVVAGSDSRLRSAIAVGFEIR